MAVLIRKKYYEINLKYWSEYWNCSREEACKRFEKYSDKDLNIMFKSYDKNEWLNLNEKEGEKNES